MEGLTSQIHRECADLHRRKSCFSMLPACLAVRPPEKQLIIFWSSSVSKNENSFVAKVFKRNSGTLLVFFCAMQASGKRITLSKPLTFLCPGCLCAEKGRQYCACSSSVHLFRLRNLLARDCLCHTKHTGAFPSAEALRCFRCPINPPYCDLWL